MKIYKVVPCAGRIITEKKERPQTSIENYSAIINQEALTGWELISVCPIEICKKKTGLKLFTENYNVFIFSKEILK